jgi:hypothetical protein
VHAALEAQVAVGAAPTHLDDRLLDTANAGLAEAHHVSLPALALGVAGIHAHQLGSEQGRFIAASASAHLEDDILLVQRVFRHQQRAQAGHDRLALIAELIQLFAGQGRHLRIGVVGHCLSLGDLGFDALQFAIGLDRVIQIGPFTSELKRLLGIRRDLWLRHQLGQFFIAPVDVCQPIEHIRHW